MHELAITQDILSLALDHAGRARATRVSALHLVLGELSTVVDDSVQFYWDIVSQGTICEGARLHFQRLPARLTCRECGTGYNMDVGPAPCPDCGSSRVQLTEGLEFRLDSIDVETEDREKGEP